MTHVPHDEAPSVLFLDQGLLKDRKGKPIRGVELFRLLLVAELLDRNIDVTLGADRSWKPIINERFPDPAKRPRLICPPPPATGTVVNATIAALIARHPTKPRFDALVFGDPRKGLRPAIRIATARRIADRFLVFAHRHPRAGSARIAAKVDLPVVAVSEDVATGFRDAGVRDVSVCYGIPNAARFHPPTTPSGSNNTQHRNDSPVRFVLLGKLPNISKGHARAVEAFNALPDETRQRCELHLASFADAEPDVAGPGIVAHRWMPHDKIPEFLRTTDVMLAISSNETFSQAAVQGMLTGLPVIATPLPVYVEKLDTGAGVICNTTQEITEAMQRLANNPEQRRRMGDIGRKIALERYAWDTDRFIAEHLFPNPQNQPTP